MARLLVLALGAPLLACAAAVVPPPPPAQGATQNRAEQLVEKAIGWQGGRARLAKVRYLQIKKMQVTIHGATEGEANQAEIKGLLFDLGRDGRPERLRFYLSTAAGARTMGFDGERYWWWRRNGSGYMNPSKEGDAEDIKRIDDARDVLRYLLLPDLAADGEPFTHTGDVKHGARTISILQKLDRKKRKTKLLLFDDGSVESVGRIETEERPVDADGDGQPDPGGQTETYVLDLRVYPREFDTIDGIKLPKRVEVQVGGKPWITAVLEGSPAFKFPDADDVDDSIFGKPK